MTAVSKSLSKGIARFTLMIAIVYGNIDSGNF